MSGVLLTSMPDVFSRRGAKQSWAGVPASASLCAEAGEPIQGDLTSKFLEVKLMLVGVVNFGQVPTLGFVGVNFLGHILTKIWSYLFGQVN